MKAHPESTKVQRQACRAVSNICIKNVDLKQEVRYTPMFSFQGRNRKCPFSHGLSTTVICHLLSNLSFPVKYYRILSYIVKSCRKLSYTVNFCQILSYIVNSCRKIVMTLGTLGSYPFQYFLIPRSRRRYSNKYYCSLIAVLGV